MKLYYSPNACSLSPHIALREAGLPFELVKVDLRSKQLPDGSSFTALSPKGYVPALVLDDGQLLTEGAVMVQYLADLKPESGLAPPPGSFERVRLQEWLHFIATELHKGMGPLYLSTLPEDYKKTVRERLAGRLSFIAEHLGSKRFLMDRFTVADGYLFYVLRSWQRSFKGELPGNLREYYQALSERPSIKAALAAEGTPA